MESSTGEFVSMYVTGRTPSDPTGTMETGVGARAGTVNYSGSRAGDYSGTSIDPSEGTTFWAAKEFITNSSAGNWATGMASFSVALPPATPTPTSTPSATPTATATATASPTATA